MTDILYLFSRFSNWIGITWDFGGQGIVVLLKLNYTQGAFKSTKIVGRERSDGDLQTVQVNLVLDGRVSHRYRMPSSMID